MRSRQETQLGGMIRPNRFPPYVASHAVHLYVCVLHNTRMNEDL